MKHLAQTDGRVSVSGMLEQLWGRRSVVINCICFHVPGHAGQDGDSFAN